MKFEINKIEWEIQEVSSLDKALNGKAPSYGTTDLHNKVISIDQNLKPTFKKKVLRHELAHAFVDSFMLDYPKSFTEEQLCEFVALYSAEILEICTTYFDRRQGE